MMQVKINFIIPYFGKFPNYMQLFLNSCAYNPGFTWTIITDNRKSYQYPDNVRVVYKTFDEIRRVIRNKFDFNVALEKPYKLCDIRPMYGYLFPEYNVGFDFWGYCDVDMILGNLEHFITDEMLTYEKIFTQGHMTIMRNTAKMNELFMVPLDGNPYYEEVLMSEKSFNFDEDFMNRPNINSICRQEGIAIWEESTIADIYTKSSDFRRVTENGFEKKSQNYYVWDGGKLYRQIKHGGIWNTEEYMYIHLQKRNMTVSILENPKTYKIIPNEFSRLEIKISDIGHKDELVKCKNPNMHYFKIRSRNLKTKIAERMHK